MRRRFRSSLSIDTKPDSTPVTDVDREVEAVLRDRIGAAYPSHGILGEEYGSEESLLDEIQDFIHRYVDVSPLFEKIASYFE